MPIYEFKCNACKAEFEKLMKMDDPVPPCPNEECQSTEVEKKVSSGGFAFKGTGYYCTDFKNK